MSLMHEHDLFTLFLVFLSSKACVQVVEKVSAGQYVEEQDLLLVCQLPDPNSTSGRFYSILRAQLLDMRTDPVLTLLTQRESKAKIVSLEEMFEHVIDNDTSEVGCMLKKQHQ